MPIQRAKTSDGRWGSKLGASIQEARDGVSSFISAYEKRSNEIVNQSIVDNTGLDVSNVKGILCNLYIYNRRSVGLVDMLRGSEREMDRSAEAFVDLATQLSHQKIMDCLSLANLTAIEEYEHMKEIGHRLHEKGESKNEESMCEFVGRTTKNLASAKDEIESAKDFPAFFESVYKCIRTSSVILTESMVIIRGLEANAKDAGVLVEPFDLQLETRLMLTTITEANRKRNEKGRSSEPQ